MPPLRNDRLLRALLRQPVDVTPIWIMRQAGRYLPEYRETRERAGDFMTLCTTPELACEVTLQPLARFPLDAAILFSDILTIPHAMGLGLTVQEGIGPRFARPVRTEGDINALAVPDPEQDLRYVIEAIRLIRKELDGKQPLIGFAGSPWTLATYMVEGGSNTAFRRIKSLIYDRPRSAHRLLDTLARAVADYLNAQTAAGAQALMIFDTWGGMLTAAAFHEFSLRYLRQVLAALRREHDGQRIPVIVFTKGSGGWLEAMAESDCDAVGLDWNIDIGEARRRIGQRVALQGNLDPAVLFAAPDRIRTEASAILASYGQGPGHVFNLGHGIEPEVEPDHVRVLVDAVHELSLPYHR